MIIGAITQTICHKCGIVRPRYVDNQKFNAGQAKCSCGGTLGSPTYNNKNRSTRWNPPMIDRTLGYYDNQLGAYISSTSDKRRICREKGFVEIKNSDIDQIKPRQEKSQQERMQEYTQVIKDAAYDANFPLKGVS